MNLRVIFFIDSTELAKNTKHIDQVNFIEIIWVIVRCKQMLTLDDLEPSCLKEFLTNSTFDFWLVYQFRDQTENAFTALRAVSCDGHKWSDKVYFLDFDEDLLTVFFLFEGLRFRLKIKLVGTLDNSYI